MRNKKGQFVIGHTEGRRFKKGHISWNKGINWPEEIKEKISKAKKGVKIWGGKRTGMDWMIGERHHAWKGNNVGYTGLHAWTKAKLGKPSICEHCGNNGLNGQKIHWANKDHKYRRNLDDWLRLCASCHKIYDLKNGLTKH